MANSGLISEMSDLYSNHYGVWGPGGRNPGRQIRLSPTQIRNLLTADSLVVWSTTFGRMVGYAIAIHAQLPGHGKVAWITQLVVHRDHRDQDVGKRLLFTAWRFSDYFAWGLLSANPYAIRALEKATRRLCMPAQIAPYATALKTLGDEQVPYLDPSQEVVANSDESRANTNFMLDHSELGQMIALATRDRPWELGDLPYGWEWFAFTFQDQQQITLGTQELQDMLAASDRVTKQAYERMQPQWNLHPWAKYAPEEIEFLIEQCGIHQGASVLDFGCGNGRHAIELARRGYHVVGVDYLNQSITEARQSVDPTISQFVRFHAGDCRTTEIGGTFELGICLYDVIGSYADDQDNMGILANLSKHIAPGGYVFLSVMNMELTERIAKNWFSIYSEPDKLFALPPSNIMEKSGNVFDPNFYMIDRDARVVYRKEQFRQGEELFEELLVRDKRYTREEIKHMCIAAGLEVVWTRLVRAGHWREALDEESDKAKEILVMCRKPVREDLQQMLFE